MLRERRVARAVHGREPVERGELIELLRLQLGINWGTAEQAIDRAVEEGHVTAWFTVAPPPGERPDVGRALADLDAQSGELAHARLILRRAVEETDAEERELRRPAPEE